MMDWFILFKKNKIYKSVWDKLKSILSHLDYEKYQNQGRTHMYRRCGTYHSIVYKNSCIKVDTGENYQLFWFKWLNSAPYYPWRTRRLVFNFQIFFFFEKGLISRFFTYLLLPFIKNFFIPPFFVTSRKYNIFFLFFYIGSTFFKIKVTLFNIPFTVKLYIIYNFVILLKDI